MQRQQAFFYLQSHNVALPLDLKNFERILTGFVFLLFIKDQKRVTDDHIDLIAYT